ncbi:Panacea domain-containing protein [Brevibacillus laterosporus]|uniref:Panacea domain-containing protein n=1 Tax=Brevibacillus laterosporus TaxID=1465 RepID=UPI0018F87AEC|nr:type II toxin-antitoxin system antitoxin SocA domain-containing protein [Brevibacillus laterosporus]MBG9772433.1 hypothetical protein [Brevibacillus laterosporus]
MPSVFDVAKYFLSRSELNSKLAITHLKLQKLVYYAQAWTLVIEGEENPIFPEHIEAWIHGPVCPVLYYDYRDYGFDVIKPVTEIDLKIFTENQQRVLDAVWKAYGAYDGRYLEDLTHQEKPWKEARNGLRDSDQSNREITHNSMREYYSSF